MIKMNWDTASANIISMAMEDTADNETTYTVLKLNSKIISLQFWIQEKDAYTQYH